MQTTEQPVLQDIVLVGGGHSHVGVLKRFAMNPVPGVRLTLICRDTHTPYSGMLPGYIAGHYQYDDVHIDLSRLAEYAGARFYRDEVIGLDRSAQVVRCKGRPEVRYDLVSINIGSSPRLADVDGAAEYATAVKPINRFDSHWQRLLDRMGAHIGPLSIAIVGAGAGGVELTLAMQYRLQRLFAQRGVDCSQLTFHLVDTAAQILPTHNPRVRKAFEDILRERGVNLHLGSAVTQVGAHRLMLDDNESIAVDEVLWATHAGGQPWLRESGLALDEHGFIKVGDTLQSLDDPRVFAAGDIAHMVNHPREKAGVFAVRQGRPLADNLCRLAQGQAPKPYHPQKRWLALISTGDRFAVASRGNAFAQGRWLWRWKDWIDRRFMAKFNELPDMAGAVGSVDTGAALNEQDALQAVSALAMRCGGCGAKVGSTVLSRALGKLQPVQRDDVLVGLHAPDDAAVLTVPAGKAVVHTVDFFRAFIDDPYIVGKVAANHSLGDIYAMGAEPQSATAIATIPYGIESKTEDTVYQMMAGALEVLNAAGCALVGGHTGEGRELAVGFAVNGLIDPDKVLSKGGLKPGDVLVVTKPLGTGTLFAAHGRLQAKGRWIDGALNSMVQSSQAAAVCLREHGATACTDITGFGLLGHLLEMTKPSDVDVELELSALPILEGAEETVAEGILSSLQPENVRLRRGIRDQQVWGQHPRYPLLFDPQTAGGLLAGVPEGRVESCLQELHRLGYSSAVAIGKVLARSGELEPIIIRG
ncbi:selenide, water dikinase SelD [Marinobacter zhejiangensis]|uniref:Selenophosphate synthase n=1 Tax=Marinobacter zhejiangensis TaxID=488535 RepID=A0A1I4RYT7_9GAMM|nr:selenide, water dikinase SelD [Marinobacter zhejiangensis]SFM57377.1 selenophosphate synthase [Marinobacter zhejiangensis]